MFSLGLLLLQLASYGHAATFANTSSSVSADTATIESSSSHSTDLSSVEFSRPGLRITSASSTDTIYASSTSDPSSQPQTTSWADCSIDCSVDAKHPKTWNWEAYSINETITAATLVVIVNTKYNTTSTKLQMAQLPSGYTLPDVNEQGTHVTTVTYPRSGKIETTIVAFPTQFIWWDDAFTWSGTLPGLLPGHTSSECLIAPEFTTVPLPSFPQQPATMLTHSLGLDLEGWMFKPTSHLGIRSNYVQSFPDIPQWQECRYTQDVLPINVPFTARFMTATVTSYDDTKPSETPQPADRMKDPAASVTPEATPLTLEPSEEAKFSAAGVSEGGPEPTPASPPQVSEAPKPGASNEQQPQATNPPAPGQSNAPPVTGKPEDLQRPQSAAEQLIPVGSETLRLTADGSTTVIILPDGKTLEPGSTYTADGIPVYVPTSGPGSEVVVGEATVTFHPTAPSAAQVLTIGSDTIPVSFAAISTNGIVLPNGITLRPGEATTIDGTSYSLGPSGTALIVDGSTISFNPASDSAIVVGTHTIPISAPSESGQGIVLPNGETLLPGHATTIAGTLISLAPSGTALIVDGTTVPLSNPALPTPPAYLTASNGGVILPNGATLLPGSQTTVDGTTFSVNPSGALILIDASTTQTIPPITSADVYATATNGGVILPNGKTLPPGSETVVDGTTFSVDPSGTLVVADGSTTKTIALKTTVSGSASSARRTGTETESESLSWKANGTASAISTTSKGAGAYIWQGLGGDKAPSKGEASGVRRVLHLWVALGIGVGFAAVFL